jgi:hypothetical protein
MGVNFKAKLRVNKITVDMNPFVENFLAHTVVGMVASLRGVEKLQSLDMHQEKGEVKIKVNSEEIPLTPFPNDIICNTLTALVSSLKDVDKKIDSWDINVKT